VRRKADRSPATPLESTVERALRERLAAERPGDAVLGEELGGAARAGRRWLLDPVDGTAQFVRGIPVWATQVALEVDGAPVAAVVSAPALGRRWWGAAGAGAFADGEPIAVSAVDRLDRAGLGHGRLAEIAEPGVRTRVLDVAAGCDMAGGYESFLAPMLVAEGALDVAVVVEAEPWDLAPAAAIVGAAGGRWTAADFRARSGRTGAVLSNAVLHGAAVAALSP
jgi:histidinol-phosphatase